MVMSGLELKNFFDVVFLNCPSKPASLFFFLEIFVFLITIEMCHDRFILERVNSHNKYIHIELSVLFIV